MLSSIIEGAFRSIVFALDKGVYWVLEQAYNIIIELSEVNILSNSTISSFANRIYLFIGIIMLFKVAISLINYFLNPDSFNDSKNGMGSVLKRIVVSLILIIIVPIVFNMAYELQAVILKNNILPNIILGEPSNIEYTENVVNKGGNFIAVSIFDAFVRPKNNDTKTDKIDVDNMPTIGSYASKIEDKETYDYKIPLSTIAGGLAAWILVMYCFDIGVRAVKLSFLQLIAPIPIISYVDPKKGDGIFKKWVSACTSAYLMIFIRLVVLYFIIFIIAELSYNNWQLFDVADGGQKDVSALAYVFVILGLLLFAKEAPQLICDILGIKSMGSFTLNPMKKLGNIPVAGKATATVIGGIDSKLHGKSFLAGAWEGAQKIPFTGDKNKSVLDAATNFKEDIKQKLHGTHAVEHYDNLIKKGAEYSAKQKGMKKKSDIFKHKEFRESFDKVEAAKEAAKKANNELNMLDKQYQAVVIARGNGTATDGDVARVYDKYVEQVTKTKQAESKLDYTKKRHDAIREKYQDDARIEDSIDTYTKIVGKGTDKPDNVPSDDPGAPIGGGNGKPHGH